MSVRAALDDSGPKEAAYGAKLGREGLGMKSKSIEKIMEIVGRRGMSME